MVRVVIERSSDGKITGYSGYGHALYASRGEDIVCAAISMLLQTTLLGLIEVVRAEVKYSQEEGSLSCRLAPGQEQDEKAQVLMETMLLGLRNIEDSYGDHFVIQEKEV